MVRHNIPLFQLIFPYILDVFEQNQILSRYDVTAFPQMVVLFRTVEVRSLTERIRVSRV